MFSWRTSVHEVGHAVAARSLGVAVRSVRVERDGSGACSLNWRTDTHTWERALDITLSGTICERLFVGPAEYHDHELKRARSWVEAIRDLAPDSLRCVVQNEPEFVAAIARAEKLLRAESSVIVQLARRLEGSGFMSGDEIESIAASRDPRVLRDRLNLREQNLLRC